MDWNTDVLSHGWDGPVYRVRTPRFEVVFTGLNAEEDLHDVANSDAEVRLPDGSRWSATFVTVAEVERLMAKWAQTGEALDGTYFWCSDGLIVRDPGIHSMTEVLVGLLAEGDLTHILKRLVENS
ncbi:hypothetical protein [Amycolatopsis sp. BJA-103]|uniref:hypothetical protein n=1 Tax=Amycolatopsis sp. BJA-103 TaxID=1911175 RepID=UPI000C779BC8|nr:hypothetical protein [Amycolatopsis sp. BJA-103]AUI60385.1 hypothetical protein BKN51_20755 [Amycolatopsis sp. BJA-103]PNE16410.1 hypothetical protein B1H26_24375 [Amycolatopsis sp. BJA-103]